MEGLGDECDRVFVVTAAAATVADTERMYQHYKLHRQQDEPPPDVSRWDRCGIETISRSNGVATMELRVPDEDQQRVLQILDLMVNSQANDPVDKAPVEPPLTWTQRRTLALLDLLEAGLAHAAATGEVDPEAAAVNVLCDYDVLVE